MQKQNEKNLIISIVRDCLNNQSHYSDLKLDFNSSNLEKYKNYDYPDKDKILSLVDSSKTFEVDESLISLIDNVCDNLINCLIDLGFLHIDL